MAQLEWLKKMAVKLDSGDNPVFKVDPELQKRYINSLGKPQSDTERSFFQYKCQMKIRGQFQSFVLNILSLPLIIFYLVKRYEDDQVEKRTDAVFMREGRPENILPLSLIRQYKTIEYNPDTKIRLSGEDKKFIKLVRRAHPFSWLFHLKSIIKIGRYSYIFNKYKPDAIIVAAEYSFTSSLLTKYCNDVWGIRHINVQHGEKLYAIWDSFFRFDEMYVWDEYYQKLFESLGADKLQFKVELPPSMTFNRNSQVKKVIDYCYYLASESKDELYVIYNAVKKLQNKGNRVIIRPHPRYSDITLVREAFSDIEIEDAGKTSIEESILRTHHAIALFSTVLNQAYHNGTKIVIDDISNREYYEKLKNMQYICLQYEHDQLSQILGAINEN